ncbi:MAG: aldolase [Dehalococcoidia bacterium]|nr:aldolase [Dehalococcoidia bacterium]
MLEEFQRIGRDLFLSSLVSSHGGNMSVRMGDRIVITHRGSQLGQLTTDDLVETGLREDDSNIMLASSETPVHRAIYLQTSALAILHCHPRVAIALSLLEDEIVPIDTEGSYLLHKVPVVVSEITSGSALAGVVATALKQYKIVMVRGHGCFATGQVLEEAYQWASCLEESAMVIYYSRTLGGQTKEYRRMSDKYKSW